MAFSADCYVGATVEEMTPPKQDETAPAVVRLTDDHRARVARVRTALTEAIGELPPSMVARLVFERGLKAFEEEHGIKPAKGAKR